MLPVLPAFSGAAGVFNAVMMTISATARWWGSVACSAHQSSGQSGVGGVGGVGTPPGSPGLGRAGADFVGAPGSPGVSGGVGGVGTPLGSDGVGSPGGDFVGTPGSPGGSGSGDAVGAPPGTAGVGCEGADGIANTQLLIANASGASGAQAWTAAPWRLWPRRRSHLARCQAHGGAAQLAAAAACMHSAAMANTVFFDQDGVSVTTRRFRVDEATYPIANLTSVAAEEIPPVRSGSIGLAAIGCGLEWACVYHSAEVPWHIVSVGVIILGAWLAIRARATYCVTITTAAGQVRAVQSDERGYVEGIVEALNDAIDEHD